MKTYEHSWKIATSQEDDYTTDFLLDYNYFKKYYKVIEIDLGKEQTLDVDSKEMQQINFTGNLKNNSSLFFIVEEAKKTTLDFLQGTMK